jgi:hypothetical protein
MFTEKTITLGMRVAFKCAVYDTILMQVLWDHSLELCAVLTCRKKGSKGKNSVFLNVSESCSSLLLPRMTVPFEICIKNA